MSTFGDVDAEDEWDEDDTRPIKLGVLVRILLSIALEHAVVGHDHQRVLARLAFAERKVTEMSKKRTTAEAPILEALLLGFFYLNVAEGP